MSQVVNTNVDRLRDIKVNGLDLTELIVGCHFHKFLREKCDKWRKGDKFCAKTTKTSVELFGRLSWGTLATKNAGWNTPAGIDFSQSIYGKLAIDPRIDTGPTNRWKSTSDNK